VCWIHEVVRDRKEGRGGFGGRSGAVPEDHAFFSSTNFLKELMDILKARVDILERRNGAQNSAGRMQIFVRTVVGINVPFEVQPSTTIMEIKENILDSQGLQP
jgi:hypothetical protein